MKDMKLKEEIIAGSSDSLGILQPADSKRVADALIAKIEDADFDVASAMEYAVRDSLSAGLTCGLGDSIVSVIERQVGRAIESCIGSKEMGDIVAGAIRDGIVARQDD